MLLKWMDRIAKSLFPDGPMSPNDRYRLYACLMWTCPTPFPHIDFHWMDEAEREAEAAAITTEE